MHKSLVSLVRRESIDEAIEKAVNDIDGLPSLKNKKVLIKPNMNSDDPYPATSNPQTVASLIELVKEKEPAEIIVADASNHNYLPTIESMKKTGLYNIVADTGATILGLENLKWIKVKPEKAKNFRQIVASILLNEVDYFISECNIKTHFLANYSMALKNMFGVISYRTRVSMHTKPRSKFWKMIAELSLVRKPDLIILDGIMAMVSGGPFKGEVKETGLITASKDPVAIDAVGLAILKTVGITEEIESRSVWKQPVMKRAVELELGAKSFEDIELKAENVSELEEIIANLK